MDSVKTIGERIKKIRKHLGMTQKQFADKIGIISTALSEIENGRYRPVIDFIEKMATVHNVNLYYLILGKGPMFQDKRMKLLMAPPIDSGIKDEVTDDFLYHFLNSPFVQYSMIWHYKRFNESDKAIIDREIIEFTSGENQGNNSQS